MNTNRTFQWSMVVTVVALAAAIIGHDFFDRAAAAPVDLIDRAQSAVGGPAAAAPAPGTAAAVPPGGVVAATGTPEVFLGFIYEAFGSQFQQQMTRDEFNELYKGMFQQIGILNDPNLNWNRLRQQFQEVNVAAAIRQLPQYLAVLEDLKVQDSWEKAYRTLPPDVRERITSDQFKTMTIASLRAYGITNPEPMTWKEVFEAQKRVLQGQRERLRKGTRIAPATVVGIFQRMIGEVATSLVAEYLPATPVVSTTASDTMLRLEMTPLVTIRFAGGRAMDGYLLPYQTLGRDPRKFIGYRPGNFGNTGIFEGVTVLERRKITEITYYDERERDFKSFTLDDYLKSLTTSGPAGAPAPPG